VAENHLLGIDIGGTKCTVVLGTNEPRVIAKKTFPTETAKGFNHAIENIKTAGQAILKENRDLKPAAIGISCGGPIDAKKGLILSPPNLPGWDEVPIRDIISQEFGLPAYIENDANACALAEWQWGAGKGCRNIIFLTFGTGMGAGLILDGKLYSGTSDLAGEVGHVRLSEDGPIGHGRAGTFEGWCSGSGIAKLAAMMVKEKLKKGEQVGFCPDLRSADTLTAKFVAGAAEQGDPVAIEILQTSGEYLGRGLAILMDILNPEKIIIGSVFIRCEKFLRPSMEKAIQKEALEGPRKVCQVVPAVLGEAIGDHASLAVAMKM
jgi:glucokinase